MPEEVKKIVETVKRQRPELDPTIQAYVTKDVKLLASIPVATGGIYAVTFSPDGKTVAAGRTGRQRFV